MALRQLYRTPDKYRDSLDLIIQEINMSTHGRKQLSVFTQLEELKSQVEVDGKQPGVKKELVYRPLSSPIVEREEVVVTVQGYILRCSLPPITRTDQIPKNPMSAKQYVMLTGLGSTEFDSAARAVLQIHTTFSATLPEETLLSWKPTRDAGFVCLQFANRYFKTKDDRDPTVIELDKEVDPSGMLQSKCPAGEHTEDNRVLYFERRTDILSGHNTYIKCNPVAIKVGQLVEIQASFCVIPITKGRYLMLHKLRSVCILSAQVQEDINEALFMTDRNIPTSPTKKTKRNVGYAAFECQVDTEETRAGFKRMRIDDDGPTQQI